MKKMLMILISALFIKWCAGGGTIDDSVTPKLVDTVIMEGFEVTLVSYTVGKAIDEYDEYQDLVYLDIKVKNTGTEQTGLNDESFYIYNQNNVKVPNISGTHYVNSVTNLGYIRAGGTASAQIIFPFSGYGTYYIEFPGINGTVTAELDIKEY